METLDPKIAKKLEEQALIKYGPKNQPQPKTSAVVPTDPPHTKVLGKFKSVFPFELFPDELIISERRVIWIHKFGPWMSRVISVLHQDVADIEASTGPLVGHLHVRNFTGGEEIIMEHLWKKDLQKARDLVESMMIKKRVGLRDTKTKEEAQQDLERNTHIDF